MPFTALSPKSPGALLPALLLLLGLAPHGAEALSLGRPQVNASLGRPLDVSIPLMLAPGERLTDSCLRAEVMAGDARVPAGLLQLRIEGEPGQQRIRLQSLARMDEPALRITLAVGCPLQLTREFNAFIDPPDNAPPAPQPAAAPAPAPVTAAAPQAAPAASARLEVAESKPRKPRPRSKPRATGPRLMLDRPEVLVADAARPVPAASAAELELTPELEAQITLLEQTVAQLRAELLARQLPDAGASAAAPDSAAVLTVAALPVATVQPAAASTRPRDPMVWVLTLAASLLAGAAAFYGSRWRETRARRERSYWLAMQAAEGAAAPEAVVAPTPGIALPAFAPAVSLPDESLHQSTRPQPRPMPWAPPLPEQPVSSAMEATQVLPVRPQAVPPAVFPSEMTVADELLDLQQQVEFLLLLGQQEAAADLLATWLGRGNSGAMPYLMLMELCQQRGDPEVFDELVKQFRQRFRVQGPAWSQSLARGRSLDASASVIAHLQVVWFDPAAAMQMLQELVARGAGPGTSHFELPAYRDLLTLYSVARDLFEAGLRGDEVDLMLPMDSSFGRDAG